MAKIIFRSNYISYNTVLFVTNYKLLMLKVIPKFLQLIFLQVELSQHTPQLDANKMCSKTAL